MANLGLQIDQNGPYRNQPPVSKGRPKGSSNLALSRERRHKEGVKTFKTLCKIRDGRIAELSYDRDGKKIAVAPDLRHLITACELLLKYSWGQPPQNVHLLSEMINNGQGPGEDKLVKNLDGFNWTKYDQLIRAALGETVNSLSTDVDNDGLQTTPDKR